MHTLLCKHASYTAYTVRIYALMTKRFYNNKNLRHYYSIIINFLNLLNDLWIVHVHKETCTIMFIASLFVIANSQKEQMIMMKEWIKCGLII